MTGTIASIQTQLNPDCIVARCRKDGCAVSLAGTPKQRLIVDFDKPVSPLGPADTRCDYLFLAEPSCRELWVASVELKKGEANLGKIIKQLRAGAKAAECFVSAAIAGKSVFRPVLVSGGISNGGLNKNERKRLRKETVKFHNKPEIVRRLKCGASLMDALPIDDKD